MAQNSTCSSLAGSCFRTCRAHHHLSVNHWSALESQRVDMTSKVPHLLVWLNNAFEMLSNRFPHWHAFREHMHYAKCLWTMHADAPRSSHVWGWRVSWWVWRGWSGPSQNCSAPLKISGGDRSKKYLEIQFYWRKLDARVSLGHGKVVARAFWEKLLMCSGCFLGHG